MIKKQLKKMLTVLLSLVMVISLVPTTVLAEEGDNSAPTIVSEQETQTGSATPASSDGYVPAVLYTADMSGWFTDAESDALTYSVASAADGSGNDVDAAVEIDGATITYTPVAAQASTTVTIAVKANDSNADSADNVTITVSVGAIPADKPANSAPDVVSGQETQTGSATPASSDGYVPAVPYTADMSGWFTDAESDTLTYSVASAADGSGNDVDAAVEIDGATITYTPAAAQASTTVTIAVKANDSNADSTSNVTITVTVGTAPDSTFANMLSGTYASNYTTEDTALEINTAEQMQSLAAFVANGYNFSGKYVRLTADIDLSSVCGQDIDGVEVSWTPIGTATDTPFSGTFDGDSHKVSELYVNSVHNYQGLFGYIKDGTVKNLSVSGSVISSSNYFGGLAGITTGIITNCFINVNVTAAGSSKLGGGVVGCISKFYGSTVTPSITGCVYTGQITVTDSGNESSRYIGTLYGLGSITQTACYSTSSISPSANYGGHNGTLATADEITSGKTVWILNTLNGTQSYSGLWSQEAGNLRLENGMTYYRLSFLNVSPSIEITFAEDGNTLASYSEETDTVVYAATGTLSLTPAVSVSEYSVMPVDSASAGDSAFSINVSSDASFSCGLKLDADTHTDQMSKIGWYTNEPSATSYTLTTADQLVGLKLLVNGDITGYSAMNFSGKTLNLGNDISLSSVCGAELNGSDVDWAPIGTQEAPFAGTFNGNGHTVSGLYIDDSNSDNQGLFGYAAGTINNLAVSGSVTGGAGVGAVAGTSAGTVSNCLSLASVSGTSAVGGVVGAGKYLTGCIYYSTGTAAGVAGSATKATGCYYLSDSAIVDALGQNMPAADFKGREMAYLIDTASGSHSNLWQTGDLHPVLGSNTVYIISLTQAYEQTGKSVTLKGTETMPVTTNENTQSAYLINGETIAMDVVSDEDSYGPIFSPNSSVTVNGDTYSITEVSSDVIMTYRFVQDVAADTSWYNTTDNKFTLTTESQLRGLASLVNDSAVSFADKTILLGSDVTIVGDDWPMIGNKTNKFFGTFDGQNHTVSGFYIKITSTDSNLTDYQGFFGYIGSQSTVKNLKLDGTVADGRYFAGVLAGYADSYCTITNCTSSGKVTLSSSAITKVGASGMVGDLDQYGIMTDCVNNADVSVSLSGSAKAGSFTMGGLIAYNDPYGVVTNCVNNGNLTVTADISTIISPMLGGITGIAYKASSYTGCVNNGAISISGFATGSTSQASVGGIVGSAFTDAAYDPASTSTYVIDNCRNNGAINCSSIGAATCIYAGGITGGSYGMYTGTKNTLYLSVVGCTNTADVNVTCTAVPKKVYVGGIVGGTGIALSLVSECTNTAAVTMTSPSGAITGPDNGVGGIIGKAALVSSVTGTVSQCVNTGVISSAAAQTGGIAGATVSGSLVTDCRNMAAVSGSDTVGGIVGALGGELCSSFNYGGSVTTSGSTAGLAVGSADENAGINAVYWLSGTSLTGVVETSDSTAATALSTDAFKSFDTVYELNSNGETVEDRGIWETGADYPVYVTETPSLVYQVKTASSGNGSVTGSKQYLSNGESYTVTFTPDSGYILKDFTVTDLNGNSYQVLFSSAANGAYSVTLSDSDDNTYPATFSGNILTCAVAGHSLKFTGDFTPTGTGTVTVTLDGNNGWFNSDKTQTTAALSRTYGNILTLSDLSQPSEYRNFIGWYADKDGTIPYNFSTVLTADTTIYAKWDINSFAVLYELNGGSWSGGEYTTVKSGETLSVPTIMPAKDDCTFTGWYSDEDCLQPFDFANTAIMQNIKIYAGWIASGQHQVIIDANGGVFSDSTTRKQLTFSTNTAIGTALDAYGASKDGSVLRGWYSDTNGGIKWDMDTVLTGDIILYAHWDGADGTPTIYSGSQDSPMELEDLSQLNALRDNVNAGNAYAGGYFKLSADMTLPDDWVPIGALKSGTANEAMGANINPFSATFDGGNKTVTVPSGGLPLFGYVREAVIRNLNVYGVKIAGYGLINNYTVDYGADGDYNSGTGGSYAAGCPDTVTIDNVTLKSGTSTLYSGFIGGGASGANIVIVRNSVVESGVVIGYDQSQSNIASFCGAFSGKIMNCSSGATVYGTRNVGGIAASKSQSMGPFWIESCTFSGSVVASGNFVGGISGSGYSSSTAPNSPCASILNCLVTGSVQGATNVGGIFGGEPAVTQCWANGIGYIENNCFLGTLTATASDAVKGAIVGFMKSLDRYNIIENNYYLSTAASAGIGQIDAIDYTTSSYSRSVNPFVDSDVCIQATAYDLASGKIAALLNSGDNGSGIWTQSGSYPAIGTDSTATYTVTLGTIGTGTASVTGLTTDIAAVYQNAGGTVTVSAAAGDGYEASQIKVVNADGTTMDITDSRSFIMPQQDATVYVTFSIKGEKYATGIEIESQPTTTNYTVGDSFNISGLTFKVTYSDGSTDTLSATSDMISGFSSGSAGTKTLTLTYLGCTATFTVTVKSVVSSNITVTFRLIGSTCSSDDIDLANGDYKGAEYVTWIPTTTYTLTSGSTVYDLFTKALGNAGLESVGADNNYVKTIYAPSVCGGYELSEFTNGPHSGWMYTVNGKHPDVGLQYKTLSSGDIVIWHYIDDYSYEDADWTADPEHPSLGDGTYYSKWLKAADTAPASSGSSGSPSGSSTTSESTTVTPSVTASGGAAAASISSSDMNSAITSAKKNGDKSIVISPKITGTARKVTVDLPKSSMSSMASGTSADLTVHTPVGNVTIPNAVLDSITSQASGDTVTVSLNAVDTSSLTAEQQAAVGTNQVYDISIMSGDSHISGFDGNSVTVSLPYTLKDGESADGIVVWYLNGSGTLQQMTAAYDETTGMASFATTHMSYYIVAYDLTAAWTNPYSDVTDTDWFYGAVKYVSQNSLMSGTADTNFDPDVNMTRSMLVTVLYRMDGTPVVTGANSFIDVKDGQWYTDAVIWASSNGIVSGYGDNLFGTADSVTREQLATILYNYAKYKGYDMTKTAELISYTDASSVASWASSAMQWAVAEGLITGMTSTTLEPSGNATRAQVATILMRFAEKSIK